MFYFTIRFIVGVIILFGIGYVSFYFSKKSGLKVVKNRLKKLRLFLNIDILGIAFLVLGNNYVEIPLVELYVYSLIMVAAILIVFLVKEILLLRYWREQKRGLK